MNSRYVNNWPATCQTTGFPAYLCLDVDVAGLLILQRANHANENGQSLTRIIQKDDREYEFADRSFSSLSVSCTGGDKTWDSPLFFRDWD